MGEQENMSLSKKTLGPSTDRNLKPSMIPAKATSPSVGFASGSVSSPYEKLMQMQTTMGNSAVVQLFSMQGKTNSVNGSDGIIQRKLSNSTGLPDSLRARFENLSGQSLDGVNVHYNSQKPAQMGALAYTQGTDIHVASGQEKHLAHEAWHAVQQQQGRVRPTMQMKSVGLNDSSELEKEADEMGRTATIQLKKDAERQVPSGDRHAMPHPYMDLPTWLVTLKRERISDLFRTADGLPGHVTQIQQELARLTNDEEHFDQQQFKQTCSEVRNGIVSAAQASSLDFDLQQFDFGSLGTLSIKRVDGKFSGSGGPK